MEYSVYYPSTSGHVNLRKRKQSLLLFDSLDDSRGLYTLMAIKVLCAKWSRQPMFRKKSTLLRQWSRWCPYILVRLFAFQNCVKVPAAHSINRRSAQTCQRQQNPHSYISEVARKYAEKMRKSVHFPMFCAFALVSQFLLLYKSAECGVLSVQGYEAPLHVRDLCT